jgi:hypothetical protein
VREGARLETDHALEPLFAFLLVEFVIAQQTAHEEILFHVVLRLLLHANGVELLHARNSYAVPILSVSEKASTTTLRRAQRRW